MTDQKRLTAAQIASRTGLDQKTVRKRGREFKGAGLQLIRGHWHFTAPVSSVTRFIARRRRARLAAERRRARARD